MRRTSRTTYLVAFTFFLVGLAYLVASGLYAGGAYFVTVSEALAMTNDAPVNMKLFGVVTTVKASAAAGARAAGENAAPAPLTAETRLEFTLADLDHPEQTIAVRFSGDAPPLFKPGAEVIARGAYDPRGRSFTAVELITKCPSKYEKQNREANSPKTP